MTSNDLIAASRRGRKKYRIDRVEISAADGNWAGARTLDVSGKKFALLVTLDSGQGEPPSPKGFVGRSAFWNIKGVIAGRLGFTAHGVSSHRSRNMAAEGPVTIRIDTGILELEPSGVDCLTRDELSALLARARDQAAGTGANEKTADNSGCESGQASQKRSSDQVSRYVVGVPLALSLSA